VQGSSPDVCAGINNDASRDACHRWGNPPGADACSGASGECSFQPAQAQMQLDAEQSAAAQACEGNTAQRICADMLTRTAMRAQIEAPCNPLP
jgi:hypothetical protein